VLPEQEVVPPPAVLPVTGASTTQTAMGLGGAALLLTGAGLLLRRRLS
jgi:LPXTG-motif cell wall-anchored protein